MASVSLFVKWVGWTRSFLRSLLISSIWRFWCLNQHTPSLSKILFSALQPLRQTERLLLGGGRGGNKLWQTQVPRRWFQTQLLFHFYWGSHCRDCEGYCLLTSFIQSRSWGIGRKKKKPVHLHSFKGNDGARLCCSPAGFAGLLTGVRCTRHESWSLLTFRSTLSLVLSKGSACYFTDSLQYPCGVLLAPFHRWREFDTEKLNDLAEVAQPASGRMQIWTQVCRTVKPRLCIAYHDTTFHTMADSHRRQRKFKNCRVKQGWGLWVIRESSICFRFFWRWGHV